MVRKRYPSDAPAYRKEHASLTYAQRVAKRTPAQQREYLAAGRARWRRWYDRTKRTSARAV